MSGWMGGWVGGWVDRWVDGSENVPRAVGTTGMDVRA